MIKLLFNFIYNSCSAFIDADMSKPIPPYPLTHEEWDALQDDA
jgi:hypothetical protein